MLSSTFEMEKKPTAKSSKNKILRLLPKSVSFSYQKSPFSPARDKRTDVNLRKGFSGPIVSVVPAEARRQKSKNFETTREPDSPKVSCIGKIKQRTHTRSKGKEMRPETHARPDEIGKSTARWLTKRPSAIKRIFGLRRKSQNEASPGYGGPPYRAPGLRQMRRFASGRENALANFDWMIAQIALEEQDGDGIFPFSAPVLVAGVGGGWQHEPRKEINLWRRRTMAAQPKPLQLSF